MNPKLHLTVATIIEHNNEFLLVEERVGDSLVINQPAGHVENGESLVEAAIRETYEETGCEVEIESLISMYRWQHPENDETFFRFAFCGKLLSKDANCRLDDGIVRALWMTHNQLEANQSRLRSPLVLRGVKDYLDNRRYPLDLLIDL